MAPLQGCNMPKFKNGLARVGDVYHYCFRVNGRYLRGSTRAHDRATAEKVLSEIRRRSLLGADAIPIEPPTIQELVRVWIQNHQSALSVQHVHNIEQITRDWLLPIIGDRRIDQVCTPAILDVRARMLEAGRSPSTANHMIRVVRLLWNYAVRMGFIERLPFKVAQLRVQRKPRPTLPASKVGEFFSAVDRTTQNLQIRTMIRMMVGLGLRATEVRMARWEWLDPERKTYTVGKAKGKEARVLPIPEWLLHHFAHQTGQLSEWMFPNRQGKPYGPTFLCRYLSIASVLVGLPRLSQHRLRSSFATLHAQAGTPLTDIQGMLGHKNITTTMIYVEQSLDAKRRAQDNLSLKLGLA